MICQNCLAGDHSFHDTSMHLLGCQQDTEGRNPCDCDVEPRRDKWLQERDKRLKEKQCES